MLPGEITTLIHKGKSTGIHTVLPNCAKIDKIFMFQERMSRGLTDEMTYSETEGVIYPFYTAKTTNSCWVLREGLVSG